jgi:DNA-binding CsgD family transcriptional regulator
MARKKLDSKHQQELEKLVMEGKTPEDISKHFSIAVSSVHNYKRMLKQRGLVIPDVRGKRPSNIPPSPAESIIEKITEPSHNGQLHDDYMKIEINNVVFYISSKAKSVSVDKNNLQVRF